MRLTRSAIGAALVVVRARCALVPRLVVFAAAFFSSAVGHAQTTVYTYDDLGRLKIMTVAGAGVNYTYDAAGNRTNVTTYPPDTTAPTQPPSASVSSIGETTATANWGASSDNVAVAGYDYRVNSGSWTSIGNVLTTGLSSLSPLTNYTFDVRARDGAGNVSTPRSASFATVDTTPPSQPGATSFSSITSTSATANWGASTDNVGVSLYEYRVNGGTWTSAGGALSVALTSLTQLTSYTFEVRAKDSTGNPSTIRSGGFTTLDGLPPSQPGATNFTALTQTTATANWGASTDNVAVVGYDYRLNGGSWVSLGNVLSVGLTGLTAYTNYTFDVRARDAVGNLSTVRSGSFQTPDTTVPGPPGYATFSSIAETTVTASWTAATDNVGVVGYDYRLNGGSWVSLANVLSVNVTGLTLYTNYTFEVRARDAATNVSGQTTSYFQTLDQTAPTQPPTLGISSITQTGATATWGASTDAGSGILRYEYRLVGQTGWISVGNVLTTNLTSLAVYGSYTFEVRAVDNVGNVGAVRSASFQTLDQTPPTQPGSLAFSNLTDTSITLSWSASTDVGSGLTSYDYNFNGGGWVSNGTVLSKSFAGLSSYTNYTFDLRARDVVGNVSTTASLPFMTRDLTGPTQPSLSFSNITGSTATASWGGSTDSGSGLWTYEYQFNSGAWVDAGTFNTFVNLTGLSAGTTYPFAVRAKDYQSNYSTINSSSFTTVASPWIAIINLSTLQPLPGYTSTYYCWADIDPFWTYGYHFCAVTATNAIIYQEDVMFGSFVWVASGYRITSNYLEKYTP